MCRILGIATKIWVSGGEIWESVFRCTIGFENTDPPVRSAVQATRLRALLPDFVFAELAVCPCAAPCVSLSHHV